MYMKNKIFLSRTLILLLTIVIISGSATAAPKKIFTDVPDNHWAERYITRMNLMEVLEGYSDGSFGINQPISRFETVTTIIRVMGLESQSASASLPASFKYPASVPDWAKKYVAMGVIQGIITGDDLISFRGGEPVKRYEVAEFIGKAMGYGKTTNLQSVNDLPYLDAKDIPSEASGYVFLLMENGIMEGNEKGSFRPNDNVTRAEMAILMAKLDEKMGKLPNQEIKGTVSQSTGSTLTIRTVDGYETLVVDQNSFIFLKDRKGTIEDIGILDWVFVVKSGIKAQLIDVSSSSGVAPTQELSGQVVGNLISINYHPELEMIISTIDQRTQTIPINDDCRVEKDGAKVLLLDILSGDQVEITLEKGRAEEILAKGTDGDRTGKIKEIVISNKALMTMTDVDNKEYTYEIKSNAKISKNGYQASLLQLKTGDYVDIKWEGKFATAVDAESRYLKEQLTGKAVKVNSDLSMLVISPDDGDKNKTITVFALEGTKIVNMDGDVSSLLSKIKGGDQIIVVGDMEDQIVLAQTIIILGTAK